MFGQLTPLRTTRLRQAERQESARVRSCSHTSLKEISHSDIYKGFSVGCKDSKETMGQISMLPRPDLNPHLIPSTSCGPDPFPCGNSPGQSPTWRMGRWLRAPYCLQSMSYNNWSDFFFCTLNCRRTKSLEEVTDDFGSAKRRTRSLFCDGLNMNVCWEKERKDISKYFEQVMTSKRDV